MKEDQQMLFNEYKILREEIDNNLKLHNTLVTFTITSVVAILGFAIPMQTAYFSLLPFVVLVPMIERIAYYRSAPTKLAAYMIVFLESKIPEVNWETRNLEFLRTQPKKRNLTFGLFAPIRYHECFDLGFITSVIFYIKYFQSSPVIQLGGWIVLALPIVFMLYISYGTYRANQFNEEREAWVVKWQQYKNQ